MFFSLSLLFISFDLVGFDLFEIAYTSKEVTYETGT